MTCCGWFYIFSLYAQVRYSCAEYINTYIHIYIYKLNLNSYFFSSGLFCFLLLALTCIIQKIKKKYT